MILIYEKCMKSRIFTDPTRNIKDKYIIIDTYIKRLENKIKNIQSDKKSEFLKTVAKLDTLSPLKTLTRGYCLTEKYNKIVKSVKQLQLNDKIELKFSDGIASATVENINLKETKEE